MKDADGRSVLKDCDCTMIDYLYQAVRLRAGQAKMQFDLHLM